MKKNIFFIAILGIVSLGLRGTDEKKSKGPFTKEEYKNASWFAKIFTTRGQEQHRILILSKGDKVSEEGDLFKKVNVNMAVTEEKEEKSEYGSVTVRTTKNYIMNHVTYIKSGDISSQNVEDVKAFAEKNQEKLFKKNKDFIANEDLQISLSEKTVSTLTDAQETALMAGVTVALLCYCYREKVKSAANSVVSASGTVCSYIVYPVAWVSGKIFSPVE